MSGVFLGSSINESLSNWDTSRVTTMACMFKNSENFNQDISSWDVSSVIDFSDMFYGVITLSNTNRAKIHNSFISNSYWLEAYNWSEFEPEPEPSPEPQPGPSPEGELLRLRVGNIHKYHNLSISRLICNQNYRTVVGTAR